MSTFSRELLRFVGELRLAEVPVSVAETLDAMRAVAAAGLGDRARMREALAAALVKNEADRESFDQVFARFFGAGSGAARADLLRDLRRLCRAVVWLTPEPAERWGIGDSAINQYAREVDTLHLCSNLAELERSLERSIRTVF